MNGRFSSQASIRLVSALFRASCSFLFTLFPEELGRYIKLQSEQAIGRTKRTSEKQSLLDQVCLCPHVLSLFDVLASLYPNKCKIWLGPEALLFKRENTYLLSQSMQPPHPNPAIFTWKVARADSTSTRYIYIYSIVMYSPPLCSVHLQVSDFLEMTGPPAAHAATGTCKPGRPDGRPVSSSSCMAQVTIVV